MIHSWGSKFVGMIFSFIILTKNYYFVGTCILHVLEFVDWTLIENHENWYPTKIEPLTVRNYAVL